MLALSHPLSLSLLFLSHALPVELVGVEEGQQEEAVEGMGGGEEGTAATFCGPSQWRRWGGGLECRKGGGEGGAGGWKEKGKMFVNVPARERATTSFGCSIRAPVPSCLHTPLPDAASRNSVSE